MCVAFAHQAEHGFHRPRIRIPKIGFEQICVFAFDCAGRGPVIAERGADHLAHFGGSFIRSHADEPVRPDADRGQRQAVVAGKDFEGSRQPMDQLRNLDQVPAGFLDCLNILCGFRQPNHRERFEVGRRPARHIVEAHRDRVHGICQGQEMLKLAFLIGFVVVGIRRKDRIDALYIPEQHCLTEQSPRGVMRASGPHWHSPCRSIHHDADRIQPFVFVQRCRLARRSAGHQKVNARVDLPAHQRPQSLLVDGPVRPERRDDCRAAPCRFHHW